MELLDRFEHNLDIHEAGEAISRLQSDVELKVRLRALRYSPANYHSTDTRPLSRTGRDAHLGQRDSVSPHSSSATKMYNAKTKKKKVQRWKRRRDKKAVKAGL
jgi:hypothetical protein